MGDDTRFEDVYKFVTADRYAGQGVRWCARCLPCGPFWPWLVSKDTRWPSSKDLNPLPAMAE
jgi:hypothetical protein